jgi:replicative DNA helicase
MENENRLNKKGAARFSTNGKPDLSVLGKKRPYDIELEMAVLGALILEKEALNSVIELLNESCFELEAHQRIFNAIRALFNSSDPVDILTVTKYLRSKGELELAKGPQYIAELTQRVNSAANIDYHTRLLIEYSIKRQLINISTELQKEAYEDTSDAFVLLDKMQQALFEVSELSIKKNYEDMGSVISLVISELEALKTQTDGLTGVPSGFTDLDRVTSGWQKSDLIILAARPGMGKTAFVLSAARNAAMQFNKGVAVFSLEMSTSQLVKRLISSEVELTSEKLRTGHLTDYEWKRLVDKTSRLSQAPIFIDDTPSLSILELKAKCRRLKQKSDIQLIIIDYLQLMSGDSGKGGNREQEIAMISRSLKQLAKELNVPVIALSQLSRAVETRGGDKRPQLSDLRESGSIEQDADMVIFLYRPEYYQITEDEEGRSTKGVGEVIIAKNRHGSTMSVMLKFINSYTKFTDLEGDLTDSSSDVFSMSSAFAEEPSASSFIVKSSRMNATLSDFEEEGPRGTPPGSDEVPF